MAAGAHVVALAITGGYLISTLVIGFISSRRGGGLNNYLVAGRNLGYLVVGFVLMSEFLGLGSTVGTAEFAHKHGIGAGWQLLTIALALVIFGFWIAPRFRRHPEDTISGMIGATYGRGARLLTSALMVYAMLAVSCALYVGGTATLVPMLSVSRGTALLIIAAATVIYLVVGGMRAVAFTNAMDAVMIIVGTAVAAATGLSQAGGFSGLTTHLNPFMFNPVSIGWGQIIAWLLANIGAVFATQYIVQALSSATTPRTARKASLVAATAVLPVGAFATIAGMAAAVRFPHGDAAQSFGLIAEHANPIAGGLIVAGVGAAMLGTIGAVTHASTHLIVSDVLPLLRGERQRVRTARWLNAGFALLPLPFALCAPTILDLVFFARGVRASIAVVLICVLMLPRWNHRPASLFGLGLAVIASSAWYLAGDPWGVDSTYLAIGIPVVAMVIGRLVQPRNAKEVRPTSRTSDLVSDEVDQ